MPTYDYRCPKCGESFQIFQSMLSDPFADCSNCGEKKIRRSITGGQGIIFKGSGFYTTDYKRNKEVNSHAQAGKASEGKKPEKKESPLKRVGFP